MSYPDFSTELDSIKNSMTSIFDAYKKEYTQTIANLNDLSANFVKFLNDFEPEVTSDIPVASLSDTIQEAAEIVTALGTSPVMQKILDEVENEFGISIRSPIALVQNIMQGSESGLLKVIIAMIHFPVKCKMLHKSCYGIWSALSAMHEFITEKGLAGTFETDVKIPEEILNRLRAAMSGLQSSLSSPFRASEYNHNATEIKRVIGMIEDIPVIRSLALGANGIVLKIFMDSVRDEVKSIYSVTESFTAECQNLLNVIKTTDTRVIEKSPKRFATAKMAVRRINEVYNQMNNSVLNQAAMIPKYIVALNTAYYILLTGKPVAGVNREPLDVSGVAVTAGTMANVLISCRKLFRFMQFPRGIAMMPSELNNLKSNLDTFEKQIDDTLDFINSLQSSPDWTSAFQIALTALALIKGADLAQELLLKGEYDEFFALTDDTSTSEGAAAAALEKLADLCDQIGLGIISGEFRSKATEMKKKNREKKAKKEARKEKKKSRVIEQIELFNKMVEQSIELNSTVTGIIFSIQSILK